MFKKWYNKKKREFKKIKFSKKIVITCILVIILYTIAQTYLSNEIGLELTPTLTTCVYAFFGTELAACALIRVFDREDAEALRKSRKNNNDKLSVG